MLLLLPSKTKKKKSIFSTQMNGTSDMSLKVRR